MNPSGFQAFRKAIGVYGVVDVAHMASLVLGAVEAVAGDKDATWAKDPPDLGEEPVLEFGCGYMMEHGERHRSAETSIPKFQGGGVSVHDRHGRVGGESLGQRRCQLCVDLHRGQLGC